jgi:hypothetical protein
MYRQSYRRQYTDKLTEQTAKISRIEGPAMFTYKLQEQQSLSYYVHIFSPFVN